MGGSDRELLTTFWFDEPESLVGGYGVTAYSFEDALNLLTEAGLPHATRPAVREDITVEQLDQNHIVPNMGVITRRGVWYPNLNSS